VILFAKYFGEVLTFCSRKIQKELLTIFSTVAPVPEVKNMKKCEQFRTVNMLPTYEKELETVVKIQLEEHFETNNLFVDEQSGFRKNHLCETALNLIIANWKLWTIKSPLSIKK
jgi:hypothetical protein